MNIISSSWNWLVTSSTDPSKFSVTIKSAGTFAIPTAVFVLGLTGHTVNPADLTNLTEQIAVVVQDILLVVSSVSGVIAFGRKIYLSATGKNPTSIIPVQQ